VTHKPWKQSSGKCWLWVKLCSEPTAVLMLQAHFFVPLSRDEISVLLWSPAQYCHFYFQIIQLRLWYWGTVLEFELRASHLLYHLRHTSSPFCSGYLERVLFAQANMAFSPPTLGLLPYLGWQVHATIPSFFHCNGVSQTLLPIYPETAVLILVSQVASITNESHQCPGLSIFLLIWTKTLDPLTHIHWELVLKTDFLIINFIWGQLQYPDLNFKLSW
jgi:hypothetical protein